MAGTISYETERALRTIFKRCLQCPDTTPSCPSCKSTEICSLVPADCNTCAHATCIANPSPAPASSGPNIGAIAGGVVGGIAGVALVVFLIWRFWIKKRREQQEREMEAEEWAEGVEDDIAQQKQRMNSFQPMHASDAISTRTRGSFANSILSRASNIIQIAYIPGVTNRNGGSGHNSLLGPVPPIPAAQRAGQQPKSPLSNDGDMLFFRPGDLRDSTYSGTSSLRSSHLVPGNRETQYSITPSLARSSMAGSDAGYRDSVAADIPAVPATTVARAAPKMVSIKSTTSTSTSPSSETPGSAGAATTTEHQDFAAASGGRGQGIQIMMPGEGGPNAGSLRGKAKQVTVGSKGRFPVRQPSDPSTIAAAIRTAHAPAVSSPLAGVPSSDADEAHRQQARLAANLQDEAADQATPLVQPVESPFFDASETPPSSRGAGAVANPYASMASSVDSTRALGKRGGKPAPLSDIIEEATKRASRDVGAGTRGSAEGPFGDRFQYE